MIAVVSFVLHCAMDVSLWMFCLALTWQP